MKNILLILVLAVLLLDCSEAHASNTTVAHQRMAAQLSAEYEVGYANEGTDRITGRPYREGPLELDTSEGWEEVVLCITCRRNRCTGTVLHGGNEVLVDTALFKGRKGTYHESGWSEFTG